MGWKSAILSPGLCVRRSRLYNTICWEFDLFSGFFVYSWIIVWADGVNGYGWCLAGDKGYGLNGLQQIPIEVECNTIPYTSTSIGLPHLCQGYHDPSVVTAKDGGIRRLGGGGFVYIRVWRGGGEEIGIVVFLFFNCSVMVRTW